MWNQYWVTSGKESAGSLLSIDHVKPGSCSALPSKTKQKWKQCKSLIPLPVLVAKKAILWHSSFKDLSEKIVNTYCHWLVKNTLHGVVMAVRNISMFINVTCSVDFTLTHPPKYMTTVVERCFKFVHNIFTSNCPVMFSLWQLFYIWCWNVLSPVYMLALSSVYCFATAFEICLPLFDGCVWSKNQCIYCVYPTEPWCTTPQQLYTNTLLHNVRPIHSQIRLT